MNYCIYNKELDQFLSLINSGKYGSTQLKLKWDDEFIYELADLNRMDDPTHISTAWPMDTDDKRGIFSSLLYRMVYREHVEERHMKDIRFVPITDADGIPDFENERAF